MLRCAIRKQTLEGPVQKVRTSSEHRNNSIKCYFSTGGFSIKIKAVQLSCFAILFKIMSNLPYFLCLDCLCLFILFHTDSMNLRSGLMPSAAGAMFFLLSRIVLSGSDCPIVVTVMLHDEFGTELQSDLIIIT